MQVNLIAAGLITTAVLMAGPPNPAQAQSCFRSSQWNGWKAPDDRTIYLKVGARVFRLDLASSCPGLRSGATLITKSHSGQYCSAIDWNLKVKTGGAAVPCIVSKMTQLTADEVAALPKGARP